MGCVGSVRSQQHDCTKKIRAAVLPLEIEAFAASLHYALLENELQLHLRQPAL